MSGDAAGLLVEDFDFELPTELIAQQPPEERGHSRMLAMDRAAGTLRDASFADLPSLLNPGDLLVLNDSRVIPARLYARRTAVRDRQEPTGQVQVLLTEPAGDNCWRALVKPGKKVGVGERLVFPSLQAALNWKPRCWSGASLASVCFALRRSTISSRHSIALATCRFRPIFGAMTRARIGAAIRRFFRASRVRWLRRRRGFTSRRRSSKPSSARGVEIARVTLHVGLGTFAPLRVSRLDEIRLHANATRFPNQPRKRSIAR
jgi:S-adenosylmethionine:tRNA ribosyltransferase-isomerase